MPSWCSTGAGWHDEQALTVPDDVTLAPLPPYGPELNPVERVWLYLRERFLSLRVLDDTEAIIDACCAPGTRSLPNHGACDPSAHIHES